MKITRVIEKKDKIIILAEGVFYNEFIDDKFYYKDEYEKKYFFEIIEIDHRNRDPESNTIYTLEASKDTLQELLIARKSRRTLNYSFLIGQRLDKVWNV